MNDRKHRRNTVSTIYLKFKRATYQPRLTSLVDAILFVYKSSVNAGKNLPIKEHFIARHNEADLLCI